MVNIDFLKPPPMYGSHGDESKPGEDQLCFLTKAVADNGVWQDINPFQQKLPIFFLQLVIITAFSRLLRLVCKFLRQPPFVAELLAGILISPSAIGRFLTNNIFAASRVMILETVANLGLAYHLFLQGLAMDVIKISTIGNKPLSIGIAGALFPFIFGVLLYYCIPDFRKDFGLGCLYWGVAISVSSFPVMADVLTTLKLLHSELGRIAISSALVNSIISVVLLMVASAISSSGKSAYLPLLSAIIFAVISVVVIRPAVLWICKRTKTEGEHYSQSTTCFILSMVLACGLITDVCGLSSMLGVFLFGLIIPQEVGDRFLVLHQDFVSDLLMPLYYVCVGLRMHNNKVFNGKGDVMLSVQIVLLSFLPKIVTTLAVSYCYKMPLREGTSLAVLMNAKSLLAIMALNLGRNHLALNDKGYALMVFTVLIMAITTSPITHYLYRPSKRLDLRNKHRALQKLKPDAELRILACVHDIQSVGGITTLLKISNATRQSPLSVFALQLIQLTKHTTELLILHIPNRIGLQTHRRVEGRDDQLFTVFEKLESENPLFSVHPLTAMSYYATMHEDIRRTAEDLWIDFIILPFHMQLNFHNKMVDMNPAYKDINDNVLSNAPCSVGVLVDRGLAKALEDDKEMVHRVVMIYIGGPDDREALAYAWRMSGHPKVNLTVLRLVPGENALDIESHDFVDSGDLVMSMSMDIETENMLDEVYLNDFRHRTADDNSIIYIEKVSNNGAETFSAMRSMGEAFDLFVVGRGLGMLTPLVVGLVDWSECPELGALGELLVASEFSSKASVLVVQQYSGNNLGTDGTTSPDSSNDQTSDWHFMNAKRMMKI